MGKYPDVWGLPEEFMVLTRAASHRYNYTSLCLASPSNTLRADESMRCSRQGSLRGIDEMTILEMVSRSGAHTDPPIHPSHYEFDPT